MSANISKKGILNGSIIERGKVARIHKNDIIINPNLITQMSSGGRTTLINNHTLSLNFGENADTYGYLNVSPAVVNGKTYTLSFEVESFPDGASWSWMLWNNKNYVFHVNSNGLQKYTFTLDVSKLDSGYSLTKFLFDDGGRNNPSGTVIFKNFKLEEGSVATPWIPNSSNAEYSNLNFSQLDNRMISPMDGNNFYEY